MDLLSMMRVRTFHLLIILVSVIPALVGAGSVMTGSVNGTSGSTLLVPVILANADPMFRIDLTLSYDPTLCTAMDVLPGDFSNTTLTPALDRGQVRVALESTDGFGREGVLAWVRFRILASGGSSKIRVLSARSSTTLTKVDGTLAVIPGVSFSRTGDNRQRVTVHTDLSTVQISGDTLTFSDGGMQILISTDGIGASSSIATGLVRSATLTSPTADVVLPQGTVTGTFSSKFSEYPSEARLILSLTKNPSLTFNESLAQEAVTSGFRVTGVVFSANSSLHGAVPGDPVMYSFRLPSGLTPTGNDSFRLALRQGKGVRLLSPIITDSGEGILYVNTTVSLVSTELALILVKEIPRPVSVSTTYSSGSILSSGAESGGGNIWGAMILTFFLIAFVVIAVFYVHRKRGS